MLDRLPTELVLPIFKLATSSAASQEVDKPGRLLLCDLCLVNRRLYGVASALLWRNVTLQKTNTVAGVVSGIEHQLEQLSLDGFEVTFTPTTPGVLALRELFLHKSHASLETWSAFLSSDIVPRLRVLTIWDLRDHRKEPVFPILSNCLLEQLDLLRLHSDYLSPIPRSLSRCTSTAVVLQLASGVEVDKTKITSFAPRHVLANTVISGPIPFWLTSLLLSQAFQPEVLHLSSTLHPRRSLDQPLKTGDQVYAFFMLAVSICEDRGVKVAWHSDIGSEAGPVPYSLKQWAKERKAKQARDADGSSGTSGPSSA
ncbi:hypothetical protein JCM10207_007815 [Rhodosporidiobolus poonsookiae]